MMPFAKSSRVKAVDIAITVLRTHASITGTYWDPNPVKGAPRLVQMVVELSRQVAATTLDVILGKRLELLDKSGSKLHL